MGKLLNWVILLGSWFLPRLKTASQKHFKDLMRSSEECNCYTELLASYSICISNWCEKLAWISAPPTERFRLVLLKWLTISINKELFYSPLQMAPIVCATNWSVKSICLSNFYNRCLYVVVFPFTPKSVITTKVREIKRASEIIQRNIHASAN